MRFYQFACLFLLFLSVAVHAQRLDQTASYRQMAGNKYVRFHYDNDFVGKTDYYYTQGYSVEVVAPALKNNPLILLLPKLSDANARYGLAFEHYGFTPTSIKSDVILYNDRPFAGAIMLKSFRSSVDTVKKLRLSAVLSLGAIGPAAFAGKMQTRIHEWTGDQVPKGWQYQIRNDFIVNYELNFEKRIYNYANVFELNTNSQLRIGTLSDKLQAGLTVRLGKMQSSFDQQNSHVRKNFQVFVYAQPLVSLIGFDATLQGGIFQKYNPYTISESDITRVVMQNNFGLVLHYRRIYLEYYQSLLTREFRSGRDHRWGGIGIGFAL